LIKFRPGGLSRQIIYERKKLLAERHIREEYQDLLKEFEFDYDDRYLFKPVPVDYIVPDGTLFL